MAVKNLDLLVKANEGALKYGREVDLYDGTIIHKENRLNTRVLLGKSRMLIVNTLSNTVLFSAPKGQAKQAIGEFLEKFYFATKVTVYDQ